MKGFGSGQPLLRFSIESLVGFRLVIRQNSDKLGCNCTERRCLRKPFWAYFPLPVRRTCPANSLTTQTHWNAWNRNENRRNENNYFAKRAGFTVLIRLRLPLPGCDAKEISAADLGLCKPRRDYALEYWQAPSLTAWQRPQPSSPLWDKVHQSYSYTNLFPSAPHTKPGEQPSSGRMLKSFLPWHPPLLTYSFGWPPIKVRSTHIHFPCWAD